MRELYRVTYEEVTEENLKNVLLSANPLREVCARPEWTRVYDERSSRLTHPGDRFGNSPRLRRFAHFESALGAWPWFPLLAHHREQLEGWRWSTGGDSHGEQNGIGPLEQQQKQDQEVGGG